MYFLDYGRRSIRDKGLQKENFFGKTTEENNELPSS